MVDNQSKTDNKDKVINYLKLKRKHAGIFADFILQAYLMDCRDHAFFRKYHLKNIMTYNSNLSYKHASLIVDLLSHLKTSVFKRPSNNDIKAGKNNVPEKLESKDGKLMANKEINLFKWPKKDQNIMVLRPYIAASISNNFEDTRDEGKNNVCYISYNSPYPMPKLNDEAFYSMKKSKANSFSDKTVLQQIRNKQRIRNDDWILVVLAILLIVLPKTLFTGFSFFKMIPWYGVLSYRYLCSNLINYTGPVRLIIFAIVYVFISVRKHKIYRLNQDLHQGKF